MQANRDAADEVGGNALATGNGRGHFDAPRRAIVNAATGLESVLWHGELTCPKFATHPFTRDLQENRTVAAKI